MEEYLLLLYSIFLKITDNPDIPLEEKIKSVLFMVGEKIKADQILLYQSNDIKKLSLRSQWSSETNEKLDPNYLITRPWLLTHLQEGETIVINDMEDPSEQIQKEIEGLTKNGILSIIAIPIAFKTKYCVFVGVNRRPWKEGDIKLCHIVGHAVLNSFPKSKRIEMRSKLLSTHDTILDMLPDGVVIHKRGKIVYANPAATGLVGTSNETTLIGKDAISFVHPDDQQMVRDRIKNFPKNMKQPLVEERFIKENGEIVFVEVAGMEIEYESEPAILVVVRDISDRVEYQNKLAKSANRFKLFFEQAFDAVYISSIEGRFLEVNEAMTRLFGYTKKELLEVNIQNLYNDIQFRDRFVKYIEKKGLVRDFEVQIRHKSGKVLNCLESAAAIKDKDGKVYTFHGIIHDVSEVKEARETLIRIQKEKSLGTMAAGIAHDFNNYLTVISGNASLLEAQFTDHPVKEIVRTIMDVTKKASDLTAQLLTYSGTHSLTKTILSVNDVVNENSDLLRLTSLQSIDLKYVLYDDIPMIFASPVQLSQIILNLFSNSAEAIKKDNGEIIISTGVTHLREEDIAGKIIPYYITTGDYVYLVISDNGEGISLEDKTRVFDPFFTTKFTGRGLGLASVLGIIRSLKGGIRLESVKGVGTSITLYFPVYESDAEDYNPTENIQVIAENSIEGKKVLIVDDEEQNRILFGKFFQFLDADPIFASNGEECLEIFKSEEIDLIFLDLIMPKMTGHEAFHEIRKMNADIPIIICSGFSSEREDFDSSHNTEFLEKPFTLEELKETLKTVKI